ncbi:glycine N-acyltransferase-like [Ptychodera flava]|uniref:glycine N-acyltransferase-like n=1 Tax=Ptychodera flava TaxID=63121 RepID=UPI003969DE05
MGRKLASVEIKELVQMLKGRLPECLSLYYLLKNSLKTDNTWPKIDVYIDCQDLATLTSIVAIWYAQEEAGAAGERGELFYLVYTLDSANLKVLLQTPGVVPLRKNSNIVCAMSKHANDKSISELLTNEFYMSLQLNKHAQSYVLDTMNESITNATKRQLPPDFTVAPLRPEHAKELRASYGHGEPPRLSRFENTIKYQQNLAVFNEKGDPVSWAVIKEHGDIGMAHTVPHYRRRGFSTFLAAKLAQLVLQSNDIPFAIISPLNEASKGGLTKLGFQRRGEEWGLQYYHQHVYN